jgi:hypothetical protein
MAGRVIKSVSFDAADALALARFWAAALGSDVDQPAGASGRIDSVGAGLAPRDGHGAGYAAASLRRASA